MRVTVSRFVPGDLEAIADYIARDNPARALTFIREIREEILRIGRNPRTYRMRPEIGKDARLAVTGHYVILFRITAKAVRIERIVCGGRDLPTLLQ
ncbi:MAG: type II toxin-antitoxin system RelE/ParE family toxin [Acidobacteriaceae bacterium]